MKIDDIKQKAIDAIPYVAVFGVAALAVYGVTKLAQAAKEIDIFPLDFGNDEYLTGLSEDSRED
jgi:predicted membrane protein